MTNDLTLPDLDTEFGPAMRALKNERQRKFAYAFTILGLSQEGAAKWAGYSEVSAGDHAYRIAAHPLMQAAIEELARVLVKTRLPKAVRVLDSILENDRADESVRAKIAFGILDRAGLSTEHEAAPSPSITRPCPRKNFSPSSSDWPTSSISRRPCAANCCTR